MLGMQHGKSKDICLTIGRNNIHYFGENSTHERLAFQGILSSEASPEQYGVCVKNFLLGVAWGAVGVGLAQEHPVLTGETWRGWRVSREGNGAEKGLENS